MNIADRMMRVMPGWAPFPKINIDNVAAYLYPERAGTPVVPSKDLPNIAPPFKDAVFFWKFPKDAVGFENVEVLAYTHTIRVAYAEPDEVDEENHTLGMDYIIPRTLSDIPEGYKLGWMMEAEFYDDDYRFRQHYGFDPRVFLPKATDGGWPVRVRTYIDFEGKYVVTETGVTDPGIRAGVHKNKELLKWIEEEVKGMNTILLFALALIHCKNATLEKVYPEPKLAKKQEKKRGIPRIVYQVITIQPMRRVRKGQEHTSVSNGAHNPFHIYRGHFKDYREGKGLFGKLNGIYWWDSYARGDEKEGIVVSDYKVGEVKK